MTAPLSVRSHERPRALPRPRSPDNAAPTQRSFAPPHGRWRDRCAAPYPRGCPTPTVARGQTRSDGAPLRRCRPLGGGVSGAPTRRTADGQTPPATTGRYVVRPGGHLHSASEPPAPAGLEDRDGALSFQRDERAPTPPNGRACLLGRRRGARRSVRRRARGLVARTTATARDERHHRGRHEHGSARPEPQRHDAGAAKRTGDHDIRSYDLSDR